MGNTDSQNKNIENTTKSIVDEFVHIPSEEKSRQDSSTIS